MPSPWTYQTFTITEPSGVTPSPWVYQTFTVTDPSDAGPSPWTYQTFTITDPATPPIRVSVLGGPWQDATILASVNGEPWQ